MDSLLEQLKLSDLRTTSSAVATMEEANVLVKTLESAIGSLSSLSAPELGIKSAVCIIRTKNFSIDLINPVFISKEEPVISFREHCPVFPLDFVNCMRFNKIVLKNGLKDSAVTLTGFEAILAQHQIDHLQGILFYDRMIRLAVVREGGKILSRDSCPCGSNRKFIVCCMKKI